MKKNEVHVFQGMSRDVHPKKQQAQFLWDAMNIRLTAINDDTLLTVTNERGPLQCTVEVADGEEAQVIPGKYLGHTTVGSNCIVFSVKDGVSYITQVELIQNDNADPQQQTASHTIKVIPLVASDQLGFDENHLIEAIGVYGSTNISKVYWTDGLKQPRMIKIGHQINDYKIINAHTFDFTPELQLREVVHVTRNPTGGAFPAGVIQYAFTYYNKYAQETNIFHTTSLHYTSFDDRGGSPDDKVSNSFSIFIENVDPQFDYLRMYSILRTTKDAEAIVTRVADVKIDKHKNSNGEWGANEITIVDTGTIGNIVDPDFLLYVGGEAITASTMTHKDNVLFLGDLQLLREEEIDNIYPYESAQDQSDEEATQYDIKCSTSLHTIPCDSQLTQQGMTTRDIIWYNTLNNGYCGGFKHGEYYKLGIQFQHKTGKWSKPIYVTTMQQTCYPSYLRKANENALTLYAPEFYWKLPPALIADALEKDYVKARGIVVFPSLYNRHIVAQGILNGTVYNDADRNSAMPYTQSSWFFRPFNVEFEHSSTATAVNVEHRHGTLLGMAPHRFAEIQGAEAVDLTNLDVDQRIKFKVDLNVVTFHSPDVEFDDSFYNFDYSPGYRLSNVGFVEWYKCYTDIDIQTETAKFADKGGGFMRGIQSESNGEIVCSGLFYSDYLVNYDNGDSKFEPNDLQKFPVLFMVYPWNNVGSLNNDINRTGEDGARSAILKTKKLSNLRIGSTIYRDFNAFTNVNNLPDYVVLENGDVTWQTLKQCTDEDTQGNERTIDVYLKFFNVDYVGMCKIKNNKGYYGNVDTLLTPATYYGKWFSNNITTCTTIADYVKAVFAADTNTFHTTMDLITNPGANEFYSILGDQSSLYKTQDAVRMKYKSTPHLVIDLKDRYLIEHYSDRGQIDQYQRERLQLIADIINEGASFKDEGYNEQDIWYPAGYAVDLRDNNVSNLTWMWGDTWYQRYDCMKTYAYTLEDQNSVIEIGSFPVETRVNIDGRYDTNRGQLSNIVAMPTNFNLINHVYSQLDNFFSYTVLDPDMYKNTRFNNQITWTLGHQATADVDEWSRITLASLYEMDGTKGPITRLYTFNDQVVCFQQDAISQVLYDERVALSASDGNPIELANSASFQGTRYFSDSIGCTNKWSICKSPSALYFLDTRQNNLCTLSSEGVQYLSRQKGFGYYLSSDANSQKWKCFYDSKYNDLYVLGDSDCLVYSELLGAFTSFMSYNNAATLFNIGSELYAIYSDDGVDEYIWRMFHGEYNNFFGEYRPFYFTFISNDEPLMAKQFTNIQLNADLYKDNVILDNRLLDYISVNDEYQSNNNVTLDFKRCKPSRIKKKFRLWNIDIPRDGRDRFANTWCKIELGTRGTTQAEKNALKNLRFVMHDLNVTYYL